MKFWRRLAAEDGNALIETAIALPFLLVVVAGTVDVGLYEERKMQVVEAANAAAGYGALTPNELNTTGMQTAAANASPNLTGLTVNASAIWTCTPGGAAVSSTSQCSNNENPLQYVQVTTSATVNAPMPLGLLGSLGSSLTVRGAATYRVRWRPS